MDKNYDHLAPTMTKKSVFRIAKMDCPSEENLIRLKLDRFKSIQSMHFDIPRRTLAVYHQDELPDIERELTSLNLDSQLVSSQAAEIAVPEETSEKKILWTVLWINFGFFVLEMLSGWLAGSMGLVADSLDMLADSIVYGLSLFAVGGTVVRKKRIATASGYFQFTLAFLGIMEVIRRFVGLDMPPDFGTMIVVSFLALTGNSICLYLLQKAKSKEAHMQASMIFTSNDVIINLGVILAAILVLWLDSNKPDLIIGTIVFLIVTRGAYRIIQLGK